MDLLASTRVKARSVDLIFTSPPFALTRPKDYGNKPEGEYLEWFAQFLPAFRRVLADTGSLVVDIGGAWLPGAPRRSTYHFALPLLLEKHFEFCQEFYWYNPAKLPSPAEWVTRRRIRVKDSVNLVLWFAKDASRAKASTLRVRRRYSDSMKSLLQGGYQTRTRPSNHRIGNGFLVDHGGAIPSSLLGFGWDEVVGEQPTDLEGPAFEDGFVNLVSMANTSSTDRYLAECRRARVKPHPARFPRSLPAFFIEFLTEPGDLVCDPFAGSNTTGEAAELARRRWLSVDLDSEGGYAGTYVRASAFRFPNAELEPGFRALPKANWVTRPAQVRPHHQTLGIEAS